MRLLTTAILGISLGGCTSLGGFAGSPQLVISDYCQSYTIIKPSRKDTIETLRQVATENAKWRSQCQPKK